jgi:hypothetical protein
MTDLLKTILRGQYEASLLMLQRCVRECPDDHWEGKIANDSFRQIAYHTLFYTDLYLEPSEHAFTLRDLNHRGGDERGPTLSAGLSKDDTLSYAEVCLKKVPESLDRETPDSLQGPSGFSWRRISRAEMHIYNIRHIQHHTGQFSAYLRRVDPAIKGNLKALPWVGSTNEPRKH